MVRHSVLILFIILSGLFSWTYSINAGDVAPDYFDEQAVTDKDGSELSKSGKSRSEALSHFAKAYIELKNQRKENDEYYRNLIGTLKNDPYANLPLQLLIQALKKKEPGKYLPELLNIAKANPRALRLNIYVVSILERQKKYPQALKLLEDCFFSLLNDKLKPREVDLLVRVADILSSLYLKLREFHRGDKFFDKVFSYPNLAGNFNLRSAALIFYQVAASKSSNDKWFWFVPSKKEEYNRKLNENVKIVDAICAKKYHNPRELLPILGYLIQHKQIRRAESIILQNVLSNPNNVSTLKQLSQLYLDCNNERSALRLAQILKKEFKLKSKYNLFIGRAALKCGDYKTAAEAFEWYLLSYPDDYGAIYLAALSYFNLDQFRKALYKLEKIKTTPEANYLIALCYQYLDKFDKALEAAQNAEKIAEKEKDTRFLNKNFYISMAFFADKNKNIKEVERVLDKILKKNPQDPEAANFLGYTWADNNMKLDEAEKLIKEALKSDPDNVAYLDSMAWVYYRKGKYELALEYMKKCLAKEDGLPDAVICDHIGDVYAAMKDMKNAMKYWKLAVELYSSDIDYDKVRKKIEKHRK